MGFHCECDGICLHDVVLIHQEGKEPTESKGILGGPADFRSQLNGNDCQ